MAKEFDPYHRWLGIPKAEQPPNYYRLLGLPIFESDLDVIEDGADRQISHVRRYDKGSHKEAANQILNELAAAQVVLLDADKKSAYDAKLKSEEADVVEPTKVKTETDLGSVPKPAVPESPIPRAEIKGAPINKLPPKPSPGLRLEPTVPPLPSQIENAGLHPGSQSSPPAAPLPPQTPGIRPAGSSPRTERSFRAVPKTSAPAPFPKRAPLPTNSKKSNVGVIIAVVLSSLALIIPAVIYFQLSTQGLEPEIVSKLAPEIFDELEEGDAAVGQETETRVADPESDGSSISLFEEDAESTESETADDLRKKEPSAFPGMEPKDNSIISVDEDPKDTFGGLGDDWEEDNSPPSSELATDLDPVAEPNVAEPSGRPTPAAEPQRESLQTLGTAFGKKHQSAVRWLACSVDGQMMVSIDDMGTMFVWRMDSKKSTDTVELGASVASHLEWLKIFHLKDGLDHYYQIVGFEKSNGQTVPRLHWWRMEKKVKRCIQSKGVVELDATVVDCTVNGFVDKSDKNIVCMDGEQIWIGTKMAGRTKPASGQSGFADESVNDRFVSISKSGDLILWEQDRKSVELEKHWSGLVSRQMLANGVYWSEPGKFAFFSRPDTPDSGRQCHVLKHEGGESLLEQLPNEYLDVCLTDGLVMGARGDGFVDLFDMAEQRSLSSFQVGTQPLTCILGHSFRKLTKSNEATDLLYSQNIVVGDFEGRLYFVEDVLEN